MECVGGMVRESFLVEMTLGLWANSGKGILGGRNMCSTESWTRWCTGGNAGHFAVLGVCVCVYMMPGTAAWRQILYPRKGTGTPPWRHSLGAVLSQWDQAVLLEGHSLRAWSRDCKGQRAAESDAGEGLHRRRAVRLERQGQMGLSRRRGMSGEFGGEGEGWFFCSWCVPGWNGPKEAGAWQNTYSVLDRLSLVDPGGSQVNIPGRQLDWSHSTNKQKNLDRSSSSPTPNNECVYFIDLVDTAFIFICPEDMLGTGCTFQQRAVFN